MNEAMTEAMTEYIEVVFNGDVTACSLGETLAALLTRLGFQEDNFATAINETFVPRSRYQTQVIENGDRIEVVAPMQGG